MWFIDSPEFDTSYEISSRCFAIGLLCGSYWLDDDLHNALIYVGY